MDEITGTGEYTDQTGVEIAVVGIAGRFPGAGNIDEFWKNLKNGVESITFFSDEELITAGVARQLLDNPNFIRAGAALESFDHFDSHFFDYTPKEAEVMDPQVRVFHEVAWEALENAGYNPDSYEGLIGIYAGAGENPQWMFRLFNSLSNPTEFLEASNLCSSYTFCTRVSYKMNLRGPSLTVQTACSTSLVAVHMAVQGLLFGECDMALTGGVSILSLETQGNMHQAGMIFSPDGHCRPFDAKAMGTIFGDGAGVVVLKRLEDAIADRDTIFAVIKGSATNNDGGQKLGYMAPSMKGQADVIRAALNVADIAPETIGYVEAHGTGTTMGDPIEISALKQAYKTKKTGFCRIGSVKSNIGHLNNAAGITGFIKTVLTLKHKAVPPCLHFESPNPEIDFENSPFSVNTGLFEWPVGDNPRRAAVNSIGGGGTNAHVILEEADGFLPYSKPGSPPPPDRSREYQLIVLSAKTRPALDNVSKNLTAYLKQHPGINASDAAFTLQTGRIPFKHKRMLVVSSAGEAADTLATLSGPSAQASPKVHTFSSNIEDKKTVFFMFPGIGSQYIGMGAELYRDEPLFRMEMDRCFDILNQLLGYDIKEILYPGESVADAPSEADIHDMEIAQPVIFAFEFALAQLLMKWGITPDALIGYSFGEYVAACIAGVFGLEDALKLVVLRGRLIHQTPVGAMLSVPLPVEDVTNILTGETGLSIAIDNGPSTVVSGDIAAVNAFEKRLKEKRVMCMRVDTSRAIHSTLMEPISAEFEEGIRRVKLAAPRVPYLSNVTGKWISDEEAVDPGYWVTHLNKTVRFADGIKEMVGEPEAVFIEIGAGRDLSVLAERHMKSDLNQKVINLVRPHQKKVPDVYYLLNRLGWLWLYGITPDWKGVYNDEKRNRIPLPTYPFESRRFNTPSFSMPPSSFPGMEAGGPGPAEPEIKTFNHWFYTPSWKRSRLPGGNGNNRPSPSPWLLFIDQMGVGKGLAGELAKKGEDVVTVRAGEKFSRVNDHTYIIDPGDYENYESLLKELQEGGKTPGTFVHLWNVTGNPAGESPSLKKPRDIDGAVELGFHSLVFLAKAIGSRQILDNIQLGIVTDNMLEVAGNDGLFPEKAVVLGPCRTIPLEFRNIKCRGIDIVLPDRENKEHHLGPVIYHLAAEFSAESDDSVVAYRGNYRWTQVFDSIPVNTSAETVPRLKEGGVYIITGGLGGIGLLLAEFLAETVRARLVLTGRSTFPPREEWEQWLEKDITDSQNKTTADKIRKFLKMEHSGARVLVLSTDITDQRQVSGMFSRCEEEFGRVNGVIHAAGVPDGVMIQLRTREESENILAAKTKGTLVLGSILEDKKPDFFILCSSITGGVISSIGQAAYCSANAFLDAYAQYKTAAGDEFTVSINWDRWKKVGFSVLIEDQHRELTGEELPGGIAAEDGIEAFKCILGETIPQVIVSPYNLDDLIRQMGAPAAENADLLGNIEESIVSGTRYGRPELETEYVAPANETQTVVADIWAAFLGLEKVGIKDDFFELGGDSLKAIIILAKIHKVLSIEIPLTAFFNAPTIEETAEYIRVNRGEGRAALDIEPAETKEYYVASSSQKRLYVLQQLDRESVFYNESETVRLECELDFQKLKTIFGKLIERHECYRTSFTMVNDELVQGVHKVSEVTFDIRRLTAFGEENQRIDEKIRDFIQPFDLSRAPLLRVAVIQTGEREYILVTDMHHIVSDGFSSQIFVSEIAALYAGEELPPIRIQYKDFAEWRSRPCQQGALKKQKPYWLEQYRDEIPVLNLPTDFPRPPYQRFEGSTLGFVLSKEQADALKGLAAKEETTLYVLLLSLFYVLLSKLSGQDDIVVGTPVLGRRHADLENIIGIFINTLPLRNVIRSEKKFTDIVGEIKVNLINALENQEYPFEELVEAIDVTRDVSRNPVFDVMFMMREIPSASELPGLKVSPYIYKKKVSKFDLTLQTEEQTDRLSITFRYNTALFKADTIRRFLSYFKKIALSVLDTPAQKIMSIEILAEEEKNKILQTFNDTSAPYPKDSTIHGLFEEQATRTPGKIALTGIGLYEKKGDTGETVQLTYRELNERANRSASLLRAKGAGPDSIVGIMTEGSVETITGIFGILKAGAAYLPIDPNYPEKRISYMLTDSRAHIVLCKTRESITLDTLCELIELSSIVGAKETLSTPPAQPGHLVYSIYTSGTTGNPKGVLLTHANLVNYVHWFKQNARITSEDNALLTSSFVFDLGYTSIYPSLLSGAGLHIAPGEMVLAPDRLLRYIRRNAVSYLKLTPSLFSVILRASEFSAENCKTLRLVVLGGEPINTGDIEKVHRLCPHMTFINHYGPTEATIGCIARYIDFNEFDAYKATPTIGRPIANTRVYILGKTLDLVPVGVPGELCISGDCLARGYLNRPELSAEKFYRSHKSYIHYRTGDLARWLPDGNIQFLGRTDDQVKIRGFRIDMGEIEHRLMKHDQVKEAVVLHKNEQGGDNYLAAYLVTVTDLEVSALREYLAERLPEYMIPHYFVQLEDIPLTRNGKVNRKALPEPKGEMLTGINYIPPETRTEHTLVRIWSEVLNLGTEVIGTASNFFELGGDSLKAIIVVSKIHKMLQVDIPLPVFFRNQNVKKLAVHIDSSEERIFDSIPPVEAKEYYPLAPAQKRLYVIQQLEPESTAYNQSLVLPMGPGIDREKLENVFRKLIDRHENLRTSIGSIDGEPVQIVRKEVPFSVAYHEEENNNVRDIIKNFVGPFDLSKAPFLKAGLIKTADHCLLILDVHHIITDEFSRSIFVNEFLALYRGEELPEMKLQYKDYAVWLRGDEKRADLNNQEAFWMNEFADGVPLLNLPIDFARPEIQSFEGGAVGELIEMDEIRKLRTLGLEEGVTLHNILLTILYILLAKVGGDENIVVGVPVLGRRHVDLQGIMGMFINTLVCRNRPAGEKTFRDFMVEVNERMLDAFDNQEYPFDELVAKFPAQRDPSRNPLCDVMFVYNPRMDIQESETDLKPGSLPGGSSENRQAKSVESQNDITMNIAEGMDRFSYSITYCSRLFEEDTVRRFLDHFCEIQSMVIENKHILLKDVTISHELLRSESGIMEEDHEEFGF